MDSAAGFRRDMLWVLNFNTRKVSIYYACSVLHWFSVKNITLCQNIREPRGYNFITRKRKRMREQESERERDGERSWNDFHSLREAWPGLERRVERGGRRGNDRVRNASLLLCVPDSRVSNSLLLVLLAILSYSSPLPDDFSFFFSFVFLFVDHSDT